MTDIIPLQSCIRMYIQRKKYIRIYNAIYTIQCFILHRIDVNILLKNIKYLSNFSKSKDKVQFLQKKTLSHKKKIKKNIHIHKKKNQLLEKKLTMQNSQVDFFKTQLDVYRDKLTEKKDIIAIYKNKQKRLQEKINTMTEIIKEKNKKHNTLIIQNKTLQEDYNQIQNKNELLQDDFAQLIEQYTNSNEARGSLENVNDSLQHVNMNLSGELNKICTRLEKTEKDLDKHKHKTIWDIIFNKVQ